MTEPAGVRILEPGDVDGVVRVFLACWRGYTGLLPDALVASLDAWAAEELVRSVLEHQGGALVAERDAVIVGYARWEPGYLASLYVDPAERGRGTGAHLLAAAEAALRDAGADETTLWVFAANDPAIGFYAAHGWVADGGTRVEERFGEPETRMRKSLGR